MLKTVSSFSGLSVDDINVAGKFYTDILGFNLIDDSMGLLLDMPSGGRLFIYQKDDHIPASFTVLNLVVEDITVAVDELEQKHNVNFERYDNLPAQQDERGILRGKAEDMGPDIAWLKDPAGNVIALLEE